MNKPNLNLINTSIISKLNPCKDRFDNWKLHYNNFQGDILEFLELDKITATDKLWVAVRILPINILETFAVDCAFAARQYAEYAASAAEHAACHAANAAADTAGAADAATNAAYYADNAAYNAANVAYYVATTTANTAYSASRHISEEAAEAAELQERENQVDALISLIKEYRKGER